jgi:hypothetical protein
MANPVGFNASANESQANETQRNNDADLQPTDLQTQDSKIQDKTLSPDPTNSEMSEFAPANQTVDWYFSGFSALEIPAGTDVTTSVLDNVGRNDDVCPVISDLNSNGLDSETTFSNPAALCVVVVGLTVFHPRTELDRQKEGERNSGDLQRARPIGVGPGAF